jgi:hypothetical protein
MHNKDPSWPMFMDELIDPFAPATTRIPVDDFRHIHQSGSVDEYISNYNRIKA